MVMFDAVAMHHWPNRSCDRERVKEDEIENPEKVKLGIRVLKREKRM